MRVGNITAMLRNEYYAGIAVYNKRSDSVVNGRHVKDPSERVTREHNQPLIDKETLHKGADPAGAEPGREA